MSLRNHRNELRISQSKLSRISGVSRFKICTYELGNGSLTADEQRRIREALQAEAIRLRDVAVYADFGQPESLPAQEGSGD